MTDTLYPRRQLLTCLLVNFSFALSTATAATHTWTGSSLLNNHWSSGTNWLPGLPNSDGTDEIIFEAGAMRTTSTVDVNHHINSIQFVDAAQPTPSFIVDGTGLLHLHGSGAGIFVHENAHTISAPLQLESPLVTISNSSPASGRLILQSPIDINGNLLRLATGSSGISLEGTLSGAGDIAVEGPGTVTVSSANSYTGNTSVVLGELQVDNSTGSATGSGNLTIQSGGVLSGRGRIDGAVDVRPGGTVAPAPFDDGGLRVGSIDFASGAKLEIDFAQNASHDLVRVTGSAALGGQLLVELNDDDPPPSALFTVLTSSSLSGVFANAPNGGRVGTVGGEGSFLVTYVSDNVQLTDFQPGLLGDYNGDDFVGQSDLDLVLLNWGETVPSSPVPAGWINQQPTGLIGQNTLDGVLLHWGNGTQTATAVPEPAGVVLLMLAAGMVGRKKR